MFLTLTVCVAAGCAEPTAPVVQATLDDALFHVRLADPLSAVGAKEIGLPLVIAQIRRGPECQFSDTSRRFECPERAVGELISESAYELLDALGRPQPTWNDAVVAIRLFTRVHGVDAGTTIDANDAATLDGLRSSRQRLTGTATITWGGMVSPGRASGRRIS